MAHLDPHKSGRSCRSSSAARARRTVTSSNSAGQVGEGMGAVPGTYGTRRKCGHSHTGFPELLWWIAILATETDSFLDYFFVEIVSKTQQYATLFNIWHCHEGIVKTHLSEVWAKCVYTPQWSLLGRFCSVWKTVQYISKCFSLVFWLYWTRAFYCMCP